MGYECFNCGEGTRILQWMIFLYLSSSAGHYSSGSHVVPLTFKLRRILLEFWRPLSPGYSRATDSKFPLGSASTPRSSSKSSNMVRRARQKCQADQSNSAIMIIMA